MTIICLKPMETKLFKFRQDASRVRALPFKDEIDG